MQADSLSAELPGKPKQLQHTWNCAKLLKTGYHISALLESSEGAEILHLIHFYLSLMNITWHIIETQ